MNEFKLFKTQKRRGVRGQGLVAYVGILVLVAVIVVTILMALESAWNRIDFPDLNDREAQQAFAPDAHVPPSDIRIVKGVHDGMEHSYILEAAGRPALGWCTYPKNKALDCHFGYTDGNR